MEIINLFLYLIGISSLSISLVDSQLINDIKNKLGFKSNNSKLKAISSIMFYWRLIPYYLFFPFLIIIIPMIIIGNVLLFFTKLSECPYCISFHLGWLMNYFYLNNDIIHSIIMGAVCVILTKYIDKWLLLKLS